jgi:hypothetical protein
MGVAGEFGALPQTTKKKTRERFYSAAIPYADSPGVSLRETPKQKTAGFLSAIPYAPLFAALSTCYGTVIPRGKNSLCGTAYGIFWKICQSTTARQSRTVFPVNVPEC